MGDRRKKKRPGARSRGIVRGVLRLVLLVLLFVAVLSSTQVLAVRYINPPSWFALGGFLSGSGARQSGRTRVVWKRIKDIAPSMRRAVLAAEDQRFLWHHGFDFVELSHALEDIYKGKRKRGASTITMQVARTVFLWPSRTWPRKIAEAYYTLLLETFLSKKRILELYLNTVDWGSGVKGVEAASRKYFSISSSDLSAPQAALLSAVLPSPHKWSVRRPNDYVRMRQRRILKDMRKMPLVGRLHQLSPSICVSWVLSLPCGPRVDRCVA
jgi:monofunctional biosynthetic peptidoglycan transglycosylase